MSKRKRDRQTVPGSRQAASDEPASWRLYERFVALLQSQKASDALTVVPNARLTGTISGASRQVDVLIDARLEDDVTRRVIVDAKRRTRKVNVKDVESFEGMMRDCRAQRGILVCTTGFTTAEQRRAQMAISLSLVTLEDLEDCDVTAWEPCLGGCTGRAPRTRGWVLYDQPFGFWTTSSPLSIMHVGKCDACHDLHIWCDEYGTRAAIRGNEAEYKCECDRMWFTAEEEEATLRPDGRPNLAVLLLMVPFTHPSTILVVDRRPLN